MLKAVEYVGISIVYSGMKLAAFVVGATVADALIKKEKAAK